MFAIAANPRIIASSSAGTCGWITQNKYDEKARALKSQQTDIAARIDQHRAGDNAFQTALEALISGTSRAADLFAH
jgi:hypothetical protein